MKNEETKKRCPRCKNEYGATTDNFYKNAMAKDGLSSWCKRCSCDGSVRLDRLMNSDDPQVIMRLLAYQEKHLDRITQEIQQSSERLIQLEAKKAHSIDMIEKIS